MQKIDVILTDGTTLTGVELSDNIHGDKVLLSCDGQRLPIDRAMIVTFSKSAYFDELEADELADLEKLGDLSRLLMRQSV